MYSAVSDYVRCRTQYSDGLSHEINLGGSSIFETDLGVAEIPAHPATGAAEAGRRNREIIDRVL